MQFAIGRHWLEPLKPIQSLTSLSSFQSLGRIPRSLLRRPLTGYPDALLLAAGSIDFALSACEKSAQGVWALAYKYY